MVVNYGDLNLANSKAVEALYGRIAAAALQQLRRHILAVSIVCDDADGLLVVARDHTGYRRPAIRMERNPLADTKLEHRRVRIHLRQEAQSRHNAVIEIDQFGFRQCIEIYWYCLALAI
jgi:hypothetical protein